MFKHLDDRKRQREIDTLRAERMFNPEPDTSWSPLVVSMFVAGLVMVTIAAFLAHHL